MDRALKFAIQNLIATAKEFNVASEILPVDPEKLKKLRRTYDLPSDLVAWYSLAEPGVFVVPRPVENIQFISSSQFEDSLIGYAYTLQADSSLIPDPRWNSAWLVIGGEGEYPVIVMKENSEDRAVYYGEALNGVWKLNMLSSNLEGFLIGIANMQDYIWVSIRGKFMKAT